MSTLQLSRSSSASLSTPTDQVHHGTHPVHLNTSVENLRELSLRDVSVQTRRSRGRRSRRYGSIASGLSQSLASGLNHSVSSGLNQLGVPLTKYDEFVGMFRMASSRDLSSNEHHEERSHSRKLSSRPRAVSRCSAHSGIRERSTSGDRLPLPSLRRTHSRISHASSHRELRPTLATTVDFDSLERQPCGFWDPARTLIWTTGSRSMVEICTRAESFQSIPETIREEAPSLPVLPRLPSRPIQEDRKPRLRTSSHIGSDLSLNSIPLADVDPPKPKVNLPKVRIERATARTRKMPRLRKSRTKDF